jgi:RNA polymerase sigma factor (sigma-70 family)
MDRPGDQELLVLARSDAAAFGVFYRRHVRDVHAYFRRRTGAGDTAFDLTAETFAAALQAVPRYEPRPEPARAWLFAIARNVLSNALRRGAVEDRARRALAMEPVMLDDEALAVLDQLERDTPAVRALSALPAEQRTAIVARHFDERSYEDIAQQLRCSPSVVRQRVSRGLRTLAAQLEECRDA